MSVLEVMVHLEVDAEEFRSDYVKTELHISDDVVSERVDALAPMDDEMLQRVAARYGAKAFAVLLVPSVVIPEQFHLLLNPEHQDSSKITRARAEAATTRSVRWATRGRLSGRRCRNPR